jgi:predicted ABC-type ATPase
VSDIVIIGGPNGAGKTTAAQVLLPQKLGIREFVNADEIARGLSPFNAEGVSVAAGRLMIARIRKLIRDRQSFAFETTCAGRGYVSVLEACRDQGWRVTLLFLWLPSPQTALDRVARRVREGGTPFRPTWWSGGIGRASPTCAAFICRWQTWPPSTTIPTRDAR